MSGDRLDSKRAWAAFFRDVGLDNVLVEEYSSYAGALIRKGLPVIFDWHHLAALLGVSTPFLSSVLNASEYHYREFSIPKRSGGERTIRAPRSALKKCQRWILENILYACDVNECAKGFVPGCSIIDHAGAHVGSHSTLKLDFKDFFPSIKKRRVVALFRSLGYGPSASLHLASLCCDKNSLPQGAPTSPSISNIVCRKFDARLSGLCRSHGWIYTRYADDLAITGDGVSRSLTKFIAKLAQEEGFLVNESKTRYYPAKRRRVITGLVVGPKQLDVPRNYKRRLSQEAFYVLKYGALSHIARVRKRNPNLLLTMIGRAAYWRNIDPDSAKAKSLYSALTAMRDRI